MTYKTLGQQHGWIVTSTGMSDSQDQDALVSFVSLAYVTGSGRYDNADVSPLGSHTGDYAKFATIGAFAASIALHPYNSNDDSRSPSRLRIYFDD